MPDRVRGVSERRRGGRSRKTGNPGKGQNNCRKHQHLQLGFVKSPNWETDISWLVPEGYELLPANQPRKSLRAARRGIVPAEKIFATTEEAPPLCRHGSEYRGVEDVRDIAQ